MKLISFRAHGTERIGVYLSDHGLALDLHEGLGLVQEMKPGDLPRRMHEFLAGGTRAMDIARAVMETADRIASAVPDALGGIAFEDPDVDWLPPVPQPSKVIAIGLNYKDHAEEQGKEAPSVPTVFAKFPSCLTGHLSDIVYPAETASLDYEAELAFVVGKPARSVTQERALDFVAGYMCMNDVTARDLQKTEGQWTRAKSLDTFGPCGPFLVTPDEVGDPHALTVECRVNGEVRQSGSTASLIFGVPELIARLTRSMTLLPGDIVTTGTPAGVGIYRNPPLLLQAGDRVDVTLGKLGTLTNTVVAA